MLLLSINSNHRNNWFSQLHKKVVNRSKKGIFSSGMAQVSLKGEINSYKTQEERKRKEKERKEKKKKEKKKRKGKRKNVAYKQHYYHKQ